jgi:hypothetical protein
MLWVLRQPTDTARSMRFSPLPSYCVSKRSSADADDTRISLSGTPWALSQARVFSTCSFKRRTPATRSLSVVWISAVHSMRSDVMRRFAEPVTSMLRVSSRVFT